MVKVHAVEQRTWDWMKLHVGIPTASEMDNLITPKWKLREGETPKTYLYKKIAEAYRGEPSHMSGQNSVFMMEQGMILEEEARAFAALELQCDIDLVGFVTSDDGRSGCSPDGMLAGNRGLEIKCPSAHVHTKYLLDGTLPDEYAVQVYTSLFVTGFSEWLFMSYRRHFPPLVLSVKPDAAILEKIAGAVDSFHERLNEGVTKLRKLT